LENPVANNLLEGVSFKVGELSLERNHWVSRVRDGNSVKGGNGTGDFVSTEEAEDTKLGKTSVVDFSTKTLFLGLFGHLGVEAKGIVKVEDRVDSITERLEGGVLTRLAALGVVRQVSATTFVPKFKGSDDGEDLPLGTNGDGIPLGFRGKVGGGVCCTGQSLRPGEVDIGLDNVSNEGKHSNTAVLDFGLTEETNGSFVTHVPEVSGAKVQRIVETNLGVKFLGKSLKISLGFRHGSCLGGILGRGKGGGTSQKRGENSKLHFKCVLFDLECVKRRGK